MKYKSELIISIVVFIFIIISYFIDIDKYIPGLTQFFPFIWIFSLIFDIYKSNKYIKNMPRNEMRIRSKNDSYYYVLPFIGGLFFCLLSFIMFFQYEGKTTGILAFSSGIILILALFQKDIGLIFCILDKYIICKNYGCNF